MTSSITRGARKARPRLSQPMLTEAQRMGLLPLDYMLAVIRDPTIDAARRDRLAIAAAPYCHRRLAEKTQKAAAAEAAEAAGSDDAWAGDLDYLDGRRSQ
jgi:phage terminase small subunit